MPAFKKNAGPGAPHGDLLVWVGDLRGLCDHLFADSWKEKWEASNWNNICPDARKCLYLFIEISFSCHFSENRTGRGQKGLKMGKMAARPPSKKKSKIEEKNHLE